MNENDELLRIARSNSEGTQAVNTLAKVMIDICQKLIAKAGFDRTVGGVVMDTPDSSGKYLVQVTSDEYRVPNGTNITFQKGSAVWVTIPEGVLRKMYISARRS